MFHNALNVLYDTAASHPEHAFLLPFIADPPTTTLQRLKGLTTGTLPTFIDAGSNFAGTAIDEDNLVSQLRAAGKNLVHLGDDTWHALFPGHFDQKLTHAYDSFNVWDLHTVDDGVIEHIIPLLQPANSSRWDVIFGHFLGVDHAGHRYGPDHPSMRAKLRQMDETIRDIIELIDDSTLLVIMGDHGMDSKGDHGGESDDEIEAALWMYSKTPVFGRTDQERRLPPPNAKVRPVGQIDLVPTLSLLLGMPIPFNNIGSPISEAFIGSKSQGWKELARVNKIASAQIKRYQHEYAIARGLEEDHSIGPLKLLADADALWDSAISARLPSTSQYREAFAAFRDYQAETLNIYRGLWARFSVPNMVHGIELLAGALVIWTLYARGLTGDMTNLSVSVLRYIGVGLGVGISVGAAASIVSPNIPMIDACLYSAGAGSVLLVALAMYKHQGRLMLPISRSLWGWLAVIFPLSLSIGFASNSYTIWEDEVLLFFLSTFGLLAGISSLRQSYGPDRILGFYHSIIFTLLTRFASLSRLCREEQMPFCRSTYYASTNSSTSAPWQLIIPFVVAVVLPSIIKSFYIGTKSYESTAKFWIEFIFRSGLGLVAVFWTLDSADDGDWLPLRKDTLKTSRMIIAQVVLGVAFVVGTTLFVWAKPCLTIVMLDAHEIEPADTPDDVLVPPNTAARKPAVQVLGYGNVHGTRYFLLVTTFVLGIVLVQKPMGAGSIAVLTWQILSLLEILDTNNLTATNSAIGPIVLGLLGSFHFFKTGHQASLSSIQWESAFIPFRTLRYPWSPVLVVLNTFGAQIIAAVAVPLTVLWKRRVSQSKAANSTKSKTLLSDVMRALATHVLFYATINLATTMWAGWLRRHLMLYRIFSPRFMMGAVILLVVDLVSIIVALGGVRWSTASVAEVFGWG